jgi:hypothetical protein
VQEPEQLPSSPRRRGPRFSFNKRDRSIDAVMQIKPVWIQLFNKAELPFTIPFLKLFFALNRILHKMVVFVPNKQLQPIFLGKSLKHFILVITNSVPQCARDSDIHGATISVHHNVGHKSITTKTKGPVNSSGTPASAGVTHFRWSTAN